MAMAFSIVKKIEMGIKTVNVSDTCSVSYLDWTGLAPHTPFFIRRSNFCDVLNVLKDFQDFSLECSQNVPKHNCKY